MRLPNDLAEDGESYSVWNAWPGGKEKSIKYICILQVAKRYWIETGDVFFQTIFQYVEHGLMHTLFQL